MKKTLMIMKKKKIVKKIWEKWKKVMHDDLYDEKK